MTCARISMSNSTGNGAIDPQWPRLPVLSLANSMLAF